MNIVLNQKIIKVVVFLEWVVVVYLHCAIKLNKLQQELGENKFAVCAPTHKASLLIGAVTVYKFIRIN